MLTLLVVATIGAKPESRAIPEPITIEKLEVPQAWNAERRRV